MDSTSNDRSSAELEADFAAVARVAARTLKPTTVRTTLLHIGDEYLDVLSGQGGECDTRRRADLGVVRIERDHFRHDPPTPIELERAIDFAEDQIMGFGSPRQPSSLWSGSAALQAWSAIAGPVLTIDTVEQWFQHLASASRGLPAAMQGLPSGRRAAAALLVLREFMHHQGFDRLDVTRAPANL